MSQADSRGAFRFVHGIPAPPSTLASEAFLGGAGRELFRSVIGAESDFELGFAPRPGRLQSDSFVATSAQARAKLNVILGGDGQLVTTGQQPGLFLGPLYTLYKTVSAIQLAARLEQCTGRPTLAAFWVAADDHDWEEIGTCHVLSTDETIATLRLEPPESRKGRSVGETELPASIAEQIERLCELVGPGACGDDPAGFAATLREAYRPGMTMSGAFISTMVRVFAHHDLVLLDSSQATVRKTAAELYNEVVRRPADVLNAMASGGARVQQAGYPVQLTPPASGTQLFYDGGSARRHLLATPNGFTCGTDDWSPEELTEVLKRKPLAFTPAAALRPVLESWLLPVAASVLGPGELSYWAQLQPLFQSLGVEMPAVAARDNWILLEARVQRLLLKLGVEAALVQLDAGEVRRQVLEAVRPEGVSSALKNIEGDIKARFTDLEAIGEAEVPGLIGAIGKARHGMESTLDDLRRVVDRRVSERESTSMEQVRRIVANLVPGGKTQERALGSASFLTRYGLELVDHLIEHTHIAGPQGQD